jgi:hypothetical protein
MPAWALVVLNENAIGPKINCSRNFSVGRAA